MRFSRVFLLCQAEKTEKKHSFLPRKEVIHPHVPVGIPCYDFTPIIGPTLDSSLLAVEPPVASLCSVHCSTCVAQVIRGMMI